MEDVRKLAEDMSRNMTDMLTLLEREISFVHDKDSQAIQSARLDVSNMLNALKNGDSTPVEEIIKKYGSNNR